MSRLLYLTGEIDDKSYRALSEEINQCVTDGDNATIIISSVGGDTYSALAIYDLITTYKELIHITTVGIGLVASAATLPLVAGSKRILRPNAWVMVHEDEPVFQDGRVTDFELAALHARRLENQWNKLLAANSKLTAEEWAGINSVEVYLTPGECLAYGMIDEVI